LQAYQLASYFTCRASRQGSKRAMGLRILAGELLHLPGKPAGVANHGFLQSMPDPFF
jgi:hypothetical protein